MVSDRVASSLLHYCASWEWRAKNWYMKDRERERERSHLFFWFFHSRILIKADSNIGAHAKCSRKKSDPVLQDSDNGVLHSAPFTVRALSCRVQFCCFKHSTIKHISKSEWR